MAARSIPFEILERLPEDVTKCLFNTGQPKSGRSPTLTWLAIAGAEAGLTNNEIARIVDFKDQQWGPIPKFSDEAPYNKWKAILKIVDIAREKYPAVLNGRYVPCSNIERRISDNWLSID